AAKRADMIWPPTGYQSIAYPYHIVATGPGGKDTAALAIVVTWRTGEAPEPLPVAGIYLGVQLENKGSATSLKKMVVTWTSNVSTDAVVRDTILPGTAGFTASGSQAFSKHYALKPLRHWGLTVKTLDALDSVRHFDSIVSLSLLAGEARVVNVNLARRYHTWNVKISLPDSLGIAGSLFKESLRVHRVRVLLDGVPVRDTIKSAGYFASAPTTHAMEYDYVRPGARAWKVEVYGDLPGWSSSLPLFAGTLTTGCAACGSSDQVSLVWMGPGSPSDPNSGSGSPIVIAPMPSVSISKVNSVIAADDFGPGGPLPKR
ncbi:MAG: hypothetical protein K0Q91_2007, partial [Fibrobacteria bacterium]|nr:hypothetical protein [Fibrobacteria bacterium]